MNPDIGGNLEVVHFDYVARKGDLFSGTVKNGEDRVLLTAPPDYLNQDCLVRIRFLREVRFGQLLGRFISSQVPEGFSGLSHNQYVLLGEWEPRMVKRNEYPALDEINRYFDPGNLRGTFYFRENRGTQKGNRVRIYPQGAIQEPLPFIPELAAVDTRKSVRAVIAESSRTLERLAETVSEHDFTPIFMEPWQ